MNKEKDSNRMRHGYTRYAGRYVLVVICLVWWNLPLQAQFSAGGTPWSFSGEYRSEAAGLLVVTPPDMAITAAEDAQHPVPYRFAINLPVNVRIPLLYRSTPRNDPDTGSRIPDPSSGTWTVLSSGDRIWMLTISAPGALALALYFDRFEIPPGGRLFFYTKNRGSLLGAYTDLTNPDAGTFATRLLPGDQVTVEYNQPDGSKTPALSISEVAYAYRGVPADFDNTGFGTSGDCEVNVVCPEGDDWQDAEKGIARVAVKKLGSTYWCSGSLVNNTRLDRAPYFLTADHCGKGATPVDLSQWVFYFLYQSPTCPNPPEEPASRTMTGAVLKAASGNVNVKGSDFLLLLLNQPVPDTFNVWFNGWNRLGIPALQGVGIHHPKGDIKKISTYTTPLISTNWNGHPEMTHWEVFWAETVSGHGVTEGGSSGSPLFDQNNRIVGTLTGGNALCDSGFLTLPDYYGKFSYSWDLNGSDSAERLDYWLDPDQTGATVLDGIPLFTPEPDPVPADLHIYPNPVSATGSAILYLNSSLLQVSGPVHLSILDAWGREVISVLRPGNGSGLISLDVSPLPDGFYLLKIWSEERLLTGRFIKL